MKMKKNYLTIGMVLLVVFMSAVVIAQPGKCDFGQKGLHGMSKSCLGGKREPGVGMVLKLKEELDLSAKQTKKLEALKDRVQGRFKSAAEFMKAKRDALKKAVESNAGEEMIRALASKVGGAIGDLTVLKASTKAEVDRILTDAQETKLKEMKEQRKKQRAEFKQQMSERKKDRKEHGKSRDPKATFAKNLWPVTPAAARRSIQNWGRRSSSTTVMALQA